jgi:hypothetical protein
LNENADYRELTKAVGLTSAKGVSYDNLRHSAKSVCPAKCSERVVLLVLGENCNVIIQEQFIVHSTSNYAAISYII